MSAQRGVCQPGSCRLLLGLTPPAGCAGSEASDSQHGTPDVDADSDDDGDTALGSTAAGVSDMPSAARAQGCGSGAQGGPSEPSEPVPELGEAQGAEEPESSHQVSSGITAARPLQIDSALHVPDTAPASSAAPLQADATQSQRTTAAGSLRDAEADRLADGDGILSTSADGPTDQQPQAPFVDSAAEAEASSTHSSLVAGYYADAEQCSRKVRPCMPFTIARLSQAYMFTAQSASSLYTCTCSHRHMTQPCLRLDS